MSLEPLDENGRYSLQLLRGMTKSNSVLSRGRRVIFTPKILFTLLNSICCRSRSPAPTHDQNHHKIDEDNYYVPR